MTTEREISKRYPPLVRCNCNDVPAANDPFIGIGIHRVVGKLALKLCLEPIRIVGKLAVLKQQLLEPFARRVARGHPSTLPKERI